MSAVHRSPEWLRFSKGMRATYQVRIDASGVPCGRCRGVIRRGMKWHLGHIVDVRLGGAVCDPGNVWPEHVRCNTQAGGRLGTSIRWSSKRRDAREPGW